MRRRGRPRPSAQQVIYHRSYPFSSEDRSNVVFLASAEAEFTQPLYGHLCNKKITGRRCWWGVGIGPSDGLPGCHRGLPGLLHDPHHAPRKRRQIQISHNIHYLLGYILHFLPCVSGLPCHCIDFLGKTGSLYIILLLLEARMRVLTKLKFKFTAVSWVHDGEHGEVQEGRGDIRGGRRWA